MLLNIFSSPQTTNSSSSSSHKPVESNRQKKPSSQPHKTHSNNRSFEHKTPSNPSRSHGSDSAKPGHNPQYRSKTSVNNEEQYLLTKPYTQRGKNVAVVKDYGPTRLPPVKDYGVQSAPPAPSSRQDDARPNTRERNRDYNNDRHPRDNRHGGPRSNAGSHGRGGHHHGGRPGGAPTAPTRGAINPNLTAKQHAEMQKEELPDIAMPKATMMTEDEKKSQRRVGGNDSMISQTAFEKLGLSRKLAEHLISIKFTKPTMIQAQSVPPLLAGKDALIQAETGSGKTLSYLLPVLQDLSSHATRLVRDDGTHAIILAPTRELALQIQDVWKEVARPFYWLVSTTIMGGEKKKSEKARLRKGVHVCIGTPGRIVDHLDSTQSWILGSIKWFILDEADRLFDLGFRESIKTIHTELMKRCDEKPRCVLVSATLSKRHLLENVFELSNMLLTEPVHIGFEGVEEIDEKIADSATKTKAKASDSDNDEDDNEDDDEDDESDDNKPSQNVDEMSDYDIYDDDDDDDDDDIRKQMLSSTLVQHHKERISSVASQTVSNATARDLSATPFTETMKDRDDSDDDSDANQAADDAEHDEGAQLSINAKFSTPKTLEQLYVKMSSRHRLVALASFLRLRIFNAMQQGNKCKMIVFVGTCASVEFLHKLFSHAYWPDDSVTLTGRSIDSTVVDYSEKIRSGQADASLNVTKAYEMKSQQNKELKQPLLETQLWKLHGNMPQKLRTETFKRFCEATEGILFSTDVSARGLDLPFVDWIVQYDAPEDTEDYIHRVGRTARIGHSGRAILFLLESEEGYLRVLKNQGAELKPIPLATLLTGLHVGLPSKSPLLQTERPLGAILQKQFEKMTGISHHLNTLAKASYIAFIRAYAAYPRNLKSIFHPRRLHLGEVAHSFACTETPSEITKYTKDILKLAQSTINPEKAARDEAEEEEQKLKDKKKSLQAIAKNVAKRNDLAEFM